VKARGAIAAKRETPQHLRVTARIASQVACALLFIHPRGFLGGVLGSGSIVIQEHMLRTASRWLDARRSRIAIRVRVGVMAMYEDS